jgi:phospholipid/cholesterol/gamma-HCH transport system permease protein
MIPLLTIAADAVGLLGSYFIESTRGQVSLSLYFSRAFGAMAVGDIIPATVKTFFFGLVIGLVGCYKGYYSSKGTAGVGTAANSAVVVSSLLLFLVDFLAVLIADIFYEI